MSLAVDQNFRTPPKHTHAIKSNAQTRFLVMRVIRTNEKGVATDMAVTMSSCSLQQDFLYRISVGVP